MLQLGMNQLQLKQRTESLQNAESSLAEMSQKLRMAEENAEKESDRVKLKIQKKYLLNHGFPTWGALRGIKVVVTCVHLYHTIVRVDGGTKRLGTPGLKNRITQS
jgi:hypothetical protein